MSGIFFEIAESVLVAIFLVLNWSSSLPFFPAGSQGYWTLLFLTIVYLVLLLAKIVWKGTHRSQLSTSL